MKHLRAIVELSPEPWEKPERAHNVTVHVMGFEDGDERRTERLRRNPISVTHLTSFGLTVHAATHEEAHAQVVKALPAMHRDYYNKELHKKFHRIGYHSFFPEHEGKPEFFGPDHIVHVKKLGEAAIVGGKEGKDNKRKGWYVLRQPPIKFRKAPAPESAAPQQAAMGESQHATLSDAWRGVARDIKDFHPKLANALNHGFMSNAVEHHLASDQKTKHKFLSKVIDHSHTYDLVRDFSGHMDAHAKRQKKLADAEPQPGTKEHFVLHVNRLRDLNDNVERAYGKGDNETDHTKAEKHFAYARELSDIHRGYFNQHLLKHYSKHKEWDRIHDKIYDTEDQGTGTYPVPYKHSPESIWQMHLS